VVERRWKVDGLIQKNRFHHVGIVVKSISEAIDKYSAALGLDKDKVVVETGGYVAGNGETEEFKYAFLPLAEGEDNFIELVEPITPGPTARYLEKHGEGLFHLALESSNILETLGDFERAGMPVAGTTPTREVLSAFLHPKFAHGVLIQVLKKGVFDSTGRISGEVIKKERG
jgi:catechol 2,3-dioxygenase-like lactoylglutathione lyase family enzyme